MIPFASRHQTPAPRTHPPSHPDMEVLKRRAAEGPTAFVHQSNITVSEDGRTVTVSQPEGNTNLRANAVQCRRAPLSAYRRFFSISIDAIDSGKEGL